MTTPLHIGCTFCGAAIGQPCRTVRGFPRDPHSRRTRASILVAPIEYRDGDPIARVTGVDREKRIVTIRCPLCGAEHWHGWDEHEEAHFTSRVPHCSIFDTRSHYWIEPTAPDRQEATG